jgi:hypothetical protein
VKRLVLASLAAVALAGCSADATGTPVPAQPPVGPYIVVISEPSQNIPKDDTSHLIAYWSCAPDADPRTWNPHGFHSLPIGTMSPDEYHARRAKWSYTEGGKQLNSLRVDVPCKPGDTITATMDAAAVAHRPTQLRCEIFAPDGTPIAREEATRPDPAPVCRTIAR